MMQDQLDRSRAETEGIMKMKAEVEGVLQGLGKIGLGGDAEVETAGGVKKEVASHVEEGEEIWAELYREFG